MIGLLLAGGLGTRLSTLTEVLPKCLMPIGGRPLLDYWVEALDRLGVDRCYVNTHHLPQYVTDYLRALNRGEWITESFESHLLGTAGTIRFHGALHEGQHLFVAHADNFITFDLTDFLIYHNAVSSSDRPITMLTFQTDMPSACGIVECDKDGVMVRYHEKIEDPPSNIANAAIFLIHPSFFDHNLLLNRAFDFCADVLPNYIGRVNTFFTTHPVVDIGSIRAIKKLITTETGTSRYFNEGFNENAAYRMASERIMRALEICQIEDF